MDTTITEELVNRAAELAVSSPLECDRAFWATYAANLGLHLSAEIEANPAAQAWRERRLVSLSFTSSHGRG